MISLGIKSRGTWALGGVAVGACETGVLQVRRAAMLLGADMVDFMWKVRVHLGELAILAAPVCPLPNELATRGHDSLGPWAFRQR